jgi:adenine-specific DNA-methyltransferase
LNDKPKVFGKAKRRTDTSDTLASSAFEEFRKSDSGRFMAVEAIEKLLAKTSAKHVILSYSSSGKATAEELYEMLSQSGKMLDFVKVDYKRNVMATMRWTNEWTREIEKGNQELLFLIQR